MTTRLTKIADESEDQADMRVNMAKTYSQHVHKRGKITVTEAEARKAEEGFEHQFDFCPRKFKTRKDMLIHRSRCIFNYNTTDEVYTLEKITAVFGHKDARWFKVKWK